MLIKLVNKEFRHGTGESADIGITYYKMPSGTNYLTEVTLAH